MLQIVSAHTVSPGSHSVLFAGIIHISQIAVIPISKKTKFVLEQTAIFLSLLWMVFVTIPVFGPLYTALFTVPLCEIAGIFFMVEWEGVSQ